MRFRRKPKPVKAVEVTFNGQVIVFARVELLEAAQAFAAVPAFFDTLGPGRVGVRIVTT